MRTLALCLLAATPATAWEFSALPVCTVSQTEVPPQVVMTFDPGTALYAISVTHPDVWAEGRTFSMQFVGPSALTISTDRQVLSDDSRTLTVTDTGFGNVLNGLQFNDFVVAALDGDSLVIPLLGAAPAVEAFRDCGATLTG